MARFFAPMDERSTGRILKRLTFGHISVRSRHPQADAAAQEAQKDNFAGIIFSLLGPSHDLRAVSEHPSAQLNKPLVMPMNACVP
jgi:hypothetical protein